LTDDAELRTTILESLEGAVSNGYAGTLLTWTDEEIAQDMIDFASDLEDQTVEAMVPHIAEWRKSMADREIPEGDDDNDDLAEMLGGHGARVVGPIMASGGMLRQLFGGGGEQEQGPPSKKARLIDTMLDSAESLSALLNADRCDEITPTERTWAPVPGAQSKAFVICAEEAKSQLDQHVYVLHQDQDTSLLWRFWTLCPNVELGASFNIFGDEKRALHRANIVIDIANNRIAKDDFAAMATGKPVKKRKRQAAARPAGAH
jgi:hypothetical protein